MTPLRRLPLWFLVPSTALLAAVLTLALDRSITTLRPRPTPTPEVPTAVPVSVVVQTPEPPVLPTVLADDAQAELMRQMQQHTLQQWGGIFVLKAERQIDLALDALTVNDITRADDELVAAKTSLDEAYHVVSEDLKPQIDDERLTIGRVRADLVINPHNLDQELRRLSDRLLSLITPLPQPQE